MGCRARAFAATGDMLDPEPFCIYEPKMISATSKA
jgi:MoaA/NifB/PqqE/SkfB family radical SAM enzyme